MATSAKTQSTITNGQIGQINDRFATKLRKSGLSAKGVQAVLSAPGGKFIDEMVAVFRQHVDAASEISEMIVCVVEVDYDIPFKEAISATKREEHLNDEVVENAPRNARGKRRVVVCFFPLKEFKNIEEVDKMLKEYGLDSDPRAVCKVNENDPVFADEHPNNTQWIDNSGKYCYLTFDRWDGERTVSVDRDGVGWDGSWWVGGVCR